VTAVLERTETSEATAALADVASAAVRLMELLPGEAPPPGGSLTVVGTGIRAMTQLTVEALAAMATADVLLHVIGEPIQEEALLAVNPTAETLTGYYADGLERSATYEAMVQHILGAVREGKRTVAAFYGHPGVFTYPSHESVRRARAAGLPARMLPAVSAEDCLWADLGVDPGDGNQAYEATDFMWFDRYVDPMAHLLLWQVGSLGNWTYESTGYDLSSFPSLVQKLLRTYPPEHPVTVYEAPFHAGAPPRIVRVPLSQLAGWQVTPATTLYLPPLRRAY
jgi:uncharacterized protein YabN with tetrapyrrole methylase and pyrophosphatase domain